jgi:hypothetical protein
MDPAPAVTLWGTGHPLREFLYSDDLASACVFLMQRLDAIFARSKEKLRLVIDETLFIQVYANSKKRKVNFALVRSASSRATSLIRSFTCRGDVSMMSAILSAWAACQVDAARNL